MITIKLLIKATLRCVVNVLIPAKFTGVTKDDARCAQALSNGIAEIQRLARPFSSEQSWASNISRLCTLVSNGENPKRFLRWGVVQETMFVAFAWYIRKEVHILQSSEDWASRWREAIKEDYVGAPVPYWGYLQSSGNRIHHAYHLKKFEEITKKDISKLQVIVEFGGGYGGMCRLVHKLGFHGEYVIFDLPVFSALQRYYLTMLGMPVYSGENNSGDMRGVRLVNDVEELDNICQKLLVATGASLFIATWSLSECPVELREKMMPIIRRFDALLVAYQENFSGIDNVDWFAHLRRKVGANDSCDSPITHLPGSRYIIAKGIQDTAD